MSGLEKICAFRDVLCNPPTVKADVAFLFKMYHCLETRRNGAGWKVVQNVPANYIVASFLRKI